MEKTELQEGELVKIELAVHSFLPNIRKPEYMIPKIYCFDRKSKTWPQNCRCHLLSYLFEVLYNQCPHSYITGHDFNRLRHGDVTGDDGLIQLVTGRHPITAICPVQLFFYWNPSWNGAQDCQNAWGSSLEAALKHAQVKESKNGYFIACADNH